MCFCERASPDVLLRVSRFSGGFADVHRDAPPGVLRVQQVWQGSQRGEPELPNRGVPCHLTHDPLSASVLHKSRSDLPKLSLIKRLPWSVVISPSYNIRFKLELNEITKYKR